MPSPLNYEPGLTLAMKCSDLDKSLAWYTDILGFSLLYRLDDMGWAEVATEVPGVNIGLSEVEAVSKGGAVPTFGVRDIDHARAALEKAGVRFDGETTTIPGMVRLATFFDPDHNALMLYQTLGAGVPGGEA